jgi:hypothetical protein
MGLGGAHAIRDEPVFEELQMGRDLAREIGLRTTGPEERNQTENDASDGRQRFLLEQECLDEPREPRPPLGLRDPLDVMVFT